MGKESHWLGIFLIFALSSLIAPHASPQSGPRIRVVQDTKTVVADDLRGFGRATFYIENVGDASLEFLHIETSCQCVFEESNLREVRPGQSAEITFGANADIRPKVVTTEIVTNDSGTPRTILTLNVYPFGWLEFEPKEIDYGKVSADSTLERRISARLYGSSGLLDIEVFDSSTNRLSARIGEPKVLENFQEYTISVVLNLSSYDASVQFNESISLLSANKQRIHEVPIRAQILYPWYANTSTVYLSSKNSTEEILLKPNDIDTKPPVRFMTEDINVSIERTDGWRDSEGAVALQVKIIGSLTTKFKDSLVRCFDQDDRCVGVLRVIRRE